MCNTKFYEVYNYSTSSWISVKNALMFSKLEFYLLEKEKFFLLGSLSPEQLKKSLIFKNINVFDISFYFDLLKPVLYYIFSIYTFYFDFNKAMRRSSWFKDVYNVFANIEGTSGLFFVHGLFFFPNYEKELIWVW
jgi:hypothetical protein